MNEDRYSSLDEDEYRQAYEAAGCNRNLIRFHQCCEKWHKPQCQRKLDIVLFIMMCFCFCLLFLGYYHDCIYKKCQWTKIETNPHYLKVGAVLIWLQKTIIWIARCKIFAAIRDNLLIVFGSLFFVFYCSTINDACKRES